MKAKCYCPKHGRLKFDNIMIRDGLPTCKKCKSVLEFGDVKPRKIETIKKNAKKKKSEK